MAKHLTNADHDSRAGASGFDLASRSVGSGGSGAPSRRVARGAVWDGSLVHWPPIVVAAVLTMGVVAALTITVRSGRRAEVVAPVATMAAVVEPPGPPLPEPEPALAPEEQIVQGGAGPEPPAPAKIEIPPVKWDLPADIAAKPPAKPKAPAAQPAACSGDFGTSVTFARNPTEAFKEAKKDAKLTFILHVSGDFEDTAFT